MIKELKQINWKSAFIIIGVMALGMLLINQTFSWYYKVEFLKTPCDLCEELNPHIRCSEVGFLGIPSTLAEESNESDAGFNWYFDENS